MNDEGFWPGVKDGFLFVLGGDNRFLIGGVLGITLAISAVIVSVAGAIALVVWLVGA